MNNSFSNQRYVHILLIAVFCILIYSNTFNVPFIWDDYPSIAENPVIKDMENFFLNTSGYQYNPRRFLGYLTFAFNYLIGGMDVRGYHVFNLAVHIINASLVYILIVLTFRTPRLNTSSLSPFSGLVALIAALFFAVHPLQTQAVTYIVQRLASLAALFYLLSICLYVKWRIVQDRENSIMGRKSFHFYIFSLICMVAAMKTKEISFTLPFTVLLYEFFFFKHRKPVYLLPVLLTLIIIPVSLLDLDQSVGVVISDVNEVTQVASPASRWVYLMTQFTVIATYIRLLLLPVNQNLDYDYPLHDSFFTFPVFLSFLLLLSLVALGVYFFFRSQHRDRYELRLVSFGIFWFFITLSVESSIIPISDPIFEHRVYLPSAGFFTAVSTTIIMMIPALKNRSSLRIITAAVVLVILVLGGATYSRNSVWNNRSGFWEDVVKKSPSKARPYNALGVAYESEGSVDKAIEQFLTAIKLKPDYAMAYYNLGVAYEAKGLTDKAIEQFLIAVKLKPDYVKAHYNLGAVYEDKGLIDKAVEHYLASVKLKPDFVSAHYNLANAYLSGGLVNDSIKHYLIVVRLKPDSPEAYNNLGIAYGRLHMYGEAVEAYRRAVTIKPDYPSAHFNLAIAYLRLSDKTSAIREAEVLKGLDPRMADKLFRIIYR